MFNPVIFREYDIRGVFQIDFDASFGALLGHAFVTFLQRRNIQSPTICIGHDARLSCPEIVNALTQGFVESGARVIHLGMVTTPMTYYSTFALPRVEGAIMVTGSHNPREYNGFKISAGKSTIYGEEIQELREIIEAKDFQSGTGSVESHDIGPSYVDRYKKEFGTLNPVPVVIDCGNGTAGCIVRKLYESVGLKPHILFEQPDGRFPNHHPDPTVHENLQDLISEVKKTGAKIGIGFDGDSDRIGVVDENGEVIFGDELMVIVARDILSRTPGQIIVGDVKCSDRLFQDIKLHDGQPIMWKTGHSLIKKKVKETGSPFGGELSGHIFFADRNFGYDDALYAGLRIIEIMSKSGKSLGDLLEGLPKSYSTPEIRVDTTEDKKKEIVAHLKKEYAQSSPRYRADFTDGVRVSFENGWALARASNTQPVLVMRFESTSQEGLFLIQKEFQDKVNALI